MGWLNTIKNQRARTLHQLQLSMQKWEERCNATWMVILSWSRNCLNSCSSLQVSPMGPSKPCFHQTFKKLPPMLIASLMELVVGSDMLLLPVISLQKYDMGKEVCELSGYGYEAIDALQVLVSFT